LGRVAFSTGCRLRGCLPTRACCLQAQGPHEGEAADGHFSSHLTWQQIGVLRLKVFAVGQDWSNDLLILVQAAPALTHHIMIFWLR
jgi:hypothetical protein